MKRLFNVLVLTLALNFLTVAGLVGWLHQTKRLDRAKVEAIREILFPKNVALAPTTQPATDPTTQPALNLDALLAKTAGRSATEQVRFIQQTFDGQMVQLERRERELADLQRQVDLAKEQLTRDRADIDRQRADLASTRDEQMRLASDKGFQDSLALYTSLPSKQVKQVFMTLDDATVMNYLQAMEPRAAARIMKEFKSPEELKRIQTIMERMRQATPGGAPITPVAKPQPQEAQAQAKE
jgi:hypothetical protein